MNIILNQLRPSIFSLVMLLCGRYRLFKWPVRNATKELPLKIDEKASRMCFERRISSRCVVIKAVNLMGESYVGKEGNECTRLNFFFFVWKGLK